jgi:ferredoxin
VTLLEAFLNEQDEHAWAGALAELLPSIHEVDRAATSIWFSFFPLPLLRAFERAEDPEKLAGELLMQGKWLLKDQVDSSHIFLYGHRFWPEVKREVAALAGAQTSPAPAGLAGLVRETVGRVAASRKVKPSLVLGITAVAFMTLRQAGLEAFRQTPGEVLIDAKHLKKSPDDILRERARDDSQGLFGFLRTTDKRWTVVWDENRDERRFQVTHTQELASGAAEDKRPWHELDARCTPEEGPIPVQCRSASCGTCWVGVLGGAEKLGEVGPRERKILPQMGYIETDEAHPLIRLSCQARTEGAVSIVIPPWNGFFGKYLKRQKESPAANVRADEQVLGEAQA